MAVLLGFGLAMDAFSVSLANGLADRNIEVFCGEKPVPIYTIETAAYWKEAAE